MRRRLQLTALVAVIAVLGVVGAAVATGGRRINERLTRLQRAAAAISTSGSGKFEGSFSRFGGKFTYKLSYRDLEGPVTQAHIHFGAENHGGGHQRVPVHEPRATARPARRRARRLRRRSRARSSPRTSSARPARASAPGEFDELMDALEAGVTYVNVHSTLYPGGEIRAQIDADRDHHGH